MCFIKNKHKSPLKDEKRQTLSTHVRRPINCW
ncbi:mCG148311 [Mus musculus]|nr:mCG148311 [Mus musculus]